MRLRVRIADPDVMMGEERDGRERREKTRRQKRPLQVVSVSVWGEAKGGRAEDMGGEGQQHQTTR